MEVDLVIAPKLQPLKLEMASGTKKVSNDIYVSSKVKKIVLIQAFAPIEARAHFGGATNQTFFNTYSRMKV
jgi:hypothetical protein